MKYTVKQSYLLLHVDHLNELINKSQSGNAANMAPQGLKKIFKKHSHQHLKNADKITGKFNRKSKWSEVKKKKHLWWLVLIYASCPLIGAEIERRLKCNIVLRAFRSILEFPKLSLVARLQRTRASHTKEKQPKMSSPQTACEGGKS